VRRVAVLQLGRFFLSVNFMPACCVLSIGLAESRSQCDHCPDEHRSLTAFMGLTFFQFEMGWFLT